MSVEAVTAFSAPPPHFLKKLSCGSLEKWAQTWLIACRFRCLGRKYQKKKSISLESRMKLTVQCPSVKPYWHTAMPGHLRLSGPAFPLQGQIGALWKAWNIFCLALCRKHLPISDLIVSDRAYTKNSLLFSHSVMFTFVTPWTAGCQASLSITNSRSLLKLMSVEWVMPSTISSSVVPFSSCLQSFPASGSFSMSQHSRYTLKHYDFWVWLFFWWGFFVFWVSFFKIYFLIEG